jgi:WD40 repeat protein/formylglycine-generating enzyme required for sulfatase activity
VDIPLSAELRSRIAVEYPLPIADAVTALVGSDNLHERRDRVVEVFRAAVRLLAVTALTARVQYGAGPTGDGAGVRETLRRLRRQSLTDGQWLGLAREVLRPWAADAQSHPLPVLVEVFHGPGAGAFVSATEGLLALRRSETVAHGATGDEPEIRKVLARRLPQLEAFLAAQRSLWREARLVAPLASPGSAEEQQRAWLLVGPTPARGHWPRVDLPARVNIPPGRLALVDPSGRLLVSLHPLAILCRPSPDATEEVFLLDRAGRSGSGAIHVAFPSLDEQVQEEVWAHIERAFAPGGGESAPVSGGAAAARPYRGLESFALEHADLFFGREELARALANRIRRHAVVTVTGPSGSGKTSLLEAGVRPVLDERVWIRMRPGAAPLRSLALQMAGAFPEDVRDAVAERLQRAPEALDTLLRARRGALSRDLVIVVDQAEELFTLCADDGQRGLFARALASAVPPDGPHRLVVGVREDFFGRLATLPGLGAVIARQVEVVTTPRAREALRRVLVGPLARFDYRFEDDALPDEIAAAVEGEPAALALLEFCADQLWERRDRVWQRLTRQAYAALGGVAGAITTHADRVLESLTPAEREAARAVLLHLVTPDGTRAVATHADLLRACGEPQLVGRVVERLMAARLLSAREASAPGGAGETSVELVHETLVEGWPRLRQWRLDAGDDLRFAYRLRQAAATWDADGRRPELLWRGALLAQLGAWRRSHTLEPRERSFAAAAERGGRRRRRWALGLTAATVAILAAVAAFAWWQSEVARSNAVAARLEGARARAAEWRALDGERTATAAGSLARRLERRAQRRELEARGHLAAVLLEKAREAQREQRWNTAAAFHAAARDQDDSFVARWGGALAALRSPRPAGTLAVGTGPIRGLCFLAADGLLAAGGEDGELALWDPRAGRSTRRLPAKGAALRDLACSADGAVLAAARGDGTVEVWTTADGTLQRRLTCDDTAAVDVAITADGAAVFVVTAKGGLCGWAVASGAPERIPSIHGGPARCVAVTPDGSRLAVGDDRGAVRVWTRGSRRAARPLATLRWPVKALAFSPDGRSLAAASFWGQVTLLAVATGRAQPPIEVGARGVPAVVWTSGGESFAAATRDGVGLWRALDGGRIALLDSAAQRATATSLAFSADDERLAVGGADGTVRLWDVAPGDRAVRRLSTGAPAVTVALHGRRLAVLAAPAASAVWDAATGARLRPLAPPDPRAGEGVGAVAFSPDGERLAVSAGAQVVLLPDLGSAPGIRLAGRSAAPVLSLAWSPAGDAIAVGDARGDIRLAHPGTLRPLRHLRGHAAAVRALAFGTDGSVLASGSDDGTARLWDAADGRLRTTVGEGGGPVTVIALSDAGDMLATGGDLGAVRLWDSASGRARCGALRHDGAVTALAFVAESRLLLSAARDGRLSLWDVAGCRERARLLDAELPILAAGASKNGDLLYWADREHVHLLECGDWCAPDVVGRLDRALDHLGVERAAVEPFVRPPEPTSGDVETGAPRRPVATDWAARDRCRKRALGQGAFVPGAAAACGESAPAAAHRPPVGTWHEAFWLSAQEVTVGEYEECVRAGACTPPGAGAACTWTVPDAEGRAVNCVDWHQAVDFCAWIGARLPSDSEWDRAAAYSGDIGPVCSPSWFHHEPRVYERESQTDCAEPLWPPELGTAAIPSLPRGPCCGHPVEPGDVLCDLRGNLREWVADDGDPVLAPWPLGGAAWVDVPRSTERVVRGDALAGGRGPAGAAARDALPSFAAPTDVGFRCAADWEPPAPCDAEGILLVEPWGVVIDEQRTYSRETLKLHIGRKAVDLRACYEEGRKRIPGLEGLVTTRFVISPTGTVVAAAVVRSTLDEPETEACILRRLRTWRFPTPDTTATTTVVYPFPFLPR